MEQQQQAMQAAERERRQSGVSEAKLRAVEELHETEVRQLTEQLRTAVEMGNIARGHCVQLEQQMLDKVSELEAKHQTATRDLLTRVRSDKDSSCSSKLHEQQMSSLAVTQEKVQLARHQEQEVAVAALHEHQALATRLCDQAVAAARVEEQQVAAAQLQQQQRLFEELQTEAAACEADDLAALKAEYEQQVSRAVRDQASIESSKLERALASQMKQSVEAAANRLDKWSSLKEQDHQQEIEYVRQREQAKGALLVNTERERRKAEVADMQRQMSQHATAQLRQQSVADAQSREHRLISLKHRCALVAAAQIIAHEKQADAQQHSAARRAEHTMLQATSPHRHLQDLQPASDARGGEQHTEALTARGGEQHTEALFDLFYPQQTGSPNQAANKQFQPLDQLTAELSRAMRA